MKMTGQNSKKKLKKLAKNKNIDLWSLDEVHFQQYGSACRMWVPPEVKNPILLHHPTRKSTGYFGAVRLGDGKFVRRRESGKFNGDSYLIFMKQLRNRAKRRGKRVVVITDNARYHHAKSHKNWREENEKFIEFLYLPPYSPDLNPIERVWKLTRRLAVHNRYFADIEDVASSVDGVFNQWRKGSDTLKKLCAII